MLYTYNEDIVELLHTVNFGQQLIDHSVVHSSTACSCATLLTDGIQLIENDNVQPAVSAQLSHTHTRERERK